MTNENAGLSDCDSAFGIRHSTFLIVPAYNESESIGDVIRSLPRDLIDQVFVGDNGSTDGTADVARSAALDAGLLLTVVDASHRRGYGSACLACIDAIRKSSPPGDSIVVFMDADGSDDSSQMNLLIEPIRNGSADLVIGSRIRRATPGSMTIPQKFGNVLSCFLIRLIWRHRFTDLGPFRAIRWKSLESLKMADPDFGWTVEMQLKAVRAGLRCVEVEVDYRKRIAGRSKVSGTVRGVFFAGTKILSLIFKSLFETRRMKP